LQLSEIWNQEHFLMAHDDYVVIEQISEVGFTKIHRAHDKRTGLVVALKVLGDDSGLQEWVREVSALGRIRSMNVVQLLESGRFSRGGYLALEWLGGQTLAGTARQHQLSLDEFVMVTACALQALHDVHGAHILHRDVTPSNLMQATDGTWKLIDFGQARPLGDASQQPLVGSVHCMAPEQFGDAVLDERTDLYSLGCTLYFALAGTFAHTGESTVEVITSHLRPEPSRLAQIRPDLPSTVVAWVEWLMSRQPMARPSSCREAERKFMSASFDSRC